MNKIVLLAFASLFAVGCNITPAPASNTNILGTLDLKFGSQEKPVFSSVNSRTITPKPDSSITAVASSFVIRDEGAIRTLTATYTLTNNTASTFQNLSLVAYSKFGNSNGSALKSINAFNGAPSSTDVYGVRPAQGTNGIVAVSDFKSDLQVYTPAESNTFTTDARTAGLMTSNEIALEYGFVARQNSTSHLRSIDPGGTGVVSISVTIPASADVSSGARFTMTFVVAENTNAHVVQSLEESLDGIAAAARANSVGVGTEVRVFGNSTSSASPKLTMPSVVLARNLSSTLSSMTGLVHSQDLAINAPIPDGLGSFSAVYGSPASRTFIVPTIAGTVSKVTLRAKITHFDLSSVRIRLTSPSGTTIVLFEDTNYFANGSDINATFDDLSGNSLVANCYVQVTCLGTFKPEHPLSGFNTSVVTGNWVVQVDDGHNDSNTGVINELVLDISVK